MLAEPQACAGQQGESADTERRALNGATSVPTEVLAEIVDEVFLPLTTRRSCASDKSGGC